MALKIKIKMLADIDLPVIRENGDWIDLRAAQDIVVGREPVTYIPLGVAIELPRGFEAILAPRSSMPKNFHIWQPNSIGVIDNSYCSDNDQWHLAATPIGFPRATIKKNERIAQFRIQLSQKATIWQKLKWMFSNGIELQFVDHLGGKQRGGLGSTGKV